MNQWIFTAALGFSLAGCTNGGPCTYEDMPFKATVVSIEKATAQSPYHINDADTSFGYDVKVVTNLPGHDTLELDEMTEQKLTKDFLEKHQIKEGLVLEGVANIITSGTCAPGGYQFKDSTLNAQYVEGGEVQ